MYEELYDLLCELGLGDVTGPLCDLIFELIGESMSFSQLQLEIGNVLHVHGADVSADDVIAHLVTLGFADFGGGEAAAPHCGSAPRDSQLLHSTAHSIVVDPNAVRTLHETARGWLDIDSGIYFDVRQHAARNDSER